MGMEDDLRNAFKYANFSGKVDPLKMMRKALDNMELVMLKRMQAQINARISVLDHQDTAFDPFIILGVNISSTREEVDKAFKAKAWTAHPDHGGNHDEMVKVNAAYEAIKLFKNWK